MRADGLHVGGAREAVGDVRAAERGGYDKDPAHDIGRADRIGDRLLNLVSRSASHVAPDRRLSPILAIDVVP